MFAVPSLRFSTFANHEAIAAAYYDQAKAKAVVTPEVQKLADEITRDKTDMRAQAEAIYNWVSRNIHYVAVYFGNGRYVPNDTGTILSRRSASARKLARSDDGLSRVARMSVAIAGNLSTMRDQSRMSLRLSGLGAVTTSAPNTRTRPRAACGRAGRARR